MNEIKENNLTLEPNLEEALHYASQGWRVLPLHTPDEQGKCSCGNEYCSRIGRHPRIRSVKDATIDENKIRRWWTKWENANVGIATGKDSGVVGLEVDPYNDGDTNLNIIKRDRELPSTLTARAEYGNTYYFFTYPNVVPDNSMLEIGRGLCLKSDDDYVVMPPSKYSNSIRYGWIDDSDIAELPNWLPNLPPLLPPKVILTGSERYSHLFGYYSCFLQLGVSKQQILELLFEINSLRCKPPLSIHEVEAHAFRADRYLNQHTCYKRDSH